MLTNHQLSSILAALPDPVFILTRSGRYAAVFGGADPRYYHDASSLVGQSIADVLTAEKTRWFLSEIDKALHSGKLHIVEYSLAGSDVKGLADDGPTQPIWFEGRVQALGFSVDGEDAVLWVASNITLRHELEEKLRQQSVTDPLTGLANRRKLISELALSFEAHRRYGATATVLAFDIDYLKNINDTLGHLIGDKVILALAQACRREMRPTDLPARYGGDEFIALLPDTDAAQAASIAEYLRRRAISDFQAIVSAAPLTISVGLSSFAAGDTSFEDALARADQALYLAKQRGRNQVATLAGG